MHRQSNSSSVSRVISQAPGADGFGSGMATGHIMAALDRVVFIGEMHGSTLQQISHTLQQVAATQSTLAATLARVEGRPAASCPHPVAPKGSWTLQDVIQLTVFAIAMAGVLLGKTPLLEALKAAGKPYGF